MRPLLICSLEPAAGKTALCVGLARRYCKEGLKVSYLKSVAPGEVGDGDAAFVKTVLELPNAVEELAPIAIAGTNPRQAAGRLKDALARASVGVDVAFIEGGNTLAEGAQLGLSAPEVARLLDARVLLVLRYRGDLLDGAIVAARELGASLAGVVINAVPPSQMAKARESLRPALQSAGVRVLGIVPQDRVLLGVTVRELAERLAAEIICCSERADDLVERLMIGAMSVDGALVYFRKHANKAVITGGDRPDVQLAALTTPTRCLILTGGFPVDPLVLARAREAGVPIVITEEDTLGAIEAIHDAFGNSRFHQRAKLDRLEALLADYVDADGLRAQLAI